MSNLIKYLSCTIFSGLFSVMSCCSKDSSIESKQLDDLTIVKTVYSDTKDIFIEVFNENQKKLQKFRYGDGISYCDTNVYVHTWLGIKEFPNDMELYDEQDSVIEQTKCVKSGERSFENMGKQIVYDCIRIKFDQQQRIKVDGMPIGKTNKANKQVTNFRLLKGCDVLNRTLVSDIEYDYERKKIKKTIYNQNGNVESVSYLNYPFRDLLEKKLYIDGEYIKTKCFANDSLKIDAKEFVDEKGSCLE